MDDPFLSPDNLGKLRGPLPGPLAPRERPLIRGQFLRGPVPMAWLEAAARLPGKGPLAVAVALWFEAGRQRRPGPVKLTNALAERLGVSRKSKYAAIDALRGAGLIDVRQEPKKSPLITILEPDRPLEGS